MNGTPTGTQAPRPQAGDATRTYRGGTVEELLPRIREELGDDAVVLRRRNGLTGGIGGFFQKQCVEIEARPGGPRVDVYDDGGAREAEPDFEPLEVPAIRNDRASREGLASPAVRALIEQAQPFAEQLQAACVGPASAAPQAAATASGPIAGEPSPPPAAGDPSPTAPTAPPPTPLPPVLVAGRRRPPQADGIERELVEAGLRPELAAAVVSETVSHLLPFATPRRLRTLVRDALARRIRVLPGWAGRGRALAVVGAPGSGKTVCVARIAAAYAAGSDLPVACLALAAPDGGAALAARLEGSGVEVIAVADGAEARARTEGLRDRALVVVDTPGVSAAGGERLGALGRELGRIGLYEVHVALPATLSGPAAREQVDAFRGLGASRIVLTHAGETSHAGPVLDVALGEALPLSFVAEGPDLLEPADARALAGRLLR